VKTNRQSDLLPGEAIQALLKKIARRACDDVRKIKCDTEARVHRLRTDMKKTRSLLRLIKHKVPSESFARAWDAATELKDLLARSRDLCVQKGIDAQLLRIDSPETESAHPTKSERQAARKISERLRHAIRDLDLGGVDLKVLVSGLDCTAVRCRKAMARSQAHSEESHYFHEWRKRVKDLWYQCSAMRAYHPLARKWEQLSREVSGYLGDEHDHALALARRSCKKSNEKIALKLAAARTAAFAAAASLLAITSDSSEPAAPLHSDP
jgi:hypothetical protein